MSATPEQIAEKLVTLVEAHFIGANEQAVKDAAALVRAQAERVRVLEGALEAMLRDSGQLHGDPECDTNSERLARAALKGEA